MKDYKIDPELQPILEFLPDFSFANPAAARKGMLSMVAALNSEIDESGVSTDDRIIQSVDGSVDIPIRLYTPASMAGTSAGIIFIHGGGFAVGSLDTEHASAVSLCRHLGVVLISVGYRLAPEHPYPAALEDCYSALCWSAENARDLRIDTDRIAVVGASAGAGLAASLALLVKERDGPALCFQYLGIPELDDRLQTTSMREFVDTPMWNRPNAELSWQFYLGEAYTPGAPEVPVTAAPGRASVDQLRELPPACITTMEFDPLRDEGLEYAQKLLQAGVSVELHSYPGTFHGSSLVPSAAISRREQNDMRAVLRRALRLE